MAGMAGAAMAGMIESESGMTNPLPGPPPSCA
jgi:hypothetical protein